jgi:RND family efflux transporter MFP subunit
VPEVVVATPVSREITDYEDFTGQTDAFRTIDIRARVTGYLDKVNFQEGAEVAAGSVLFEIDPRPYQAEFEGAEAAVAQAQARFDRLESDLRRNTILFTKGTITQAQFDQITADQSEAAAALSAAKASLSLSKLNLEFTKVVAPIGGRVSRQFIDPGNLVMGDETILTRIVSQEPMYVYFDIDERTMLRLRRLVQNTVSSSVPQTDLPLFMGLADEEGFPHRGTINFEENRVEPGTGTLRVRAVFANPERLLTPGLFVRVRIPIGQPYRALLIPEQALGTDQGQKFVFVVGDKNEVEYRPVKVGALDDGFRVIPEGLALDERVVVSGLQRVRPGAKVQIKADEAPQGPGLAAAEKSK